MSDHIAETIYWLAKRDYVDIIEKLINDYQDENPQALAEICGGCINNSKSIECILSHMAFSKQQINSALVSTDVYSCQKIDVLTILLRYGADINYTTRNFVTSEALYRACSFGSRIMFDLLQENGALLDGQDIDFFYKCFDNRWDDVCFSMLHNFDWSVHEFYVMYCITITGNLERFHKWLSHTTHFGDYADKLITQYFKTHLNYNFVFDENKINVSCENMLSMLMENGASVNFNDCRQICLNWPDSKFKAIRLVLGKYNHPNMNDYNQIRPDI